MSEVNCIIRISAAAVLSAVDFAAVNDGRYYLAGVHVSPNAEGGASATATNGHILGSFVDPCGHAERAVILPITKAHKSLLKKGEWVEMDGNGQITIVDAWQETLWISPKPEIVAKYPDLKALIAKRSQWEEGIAAGFSPSLLALIETASKGRNKYQAVRFFRRKAESEHRTALVTIGTLGFIMIMPMRDGGADAALSVVPSNLFAPEQEATA